MCTYYWPFRTARQANFIPYTTGPPQSELPGRPTWHHIPQDQNSQNCQASQLHTIYHRTTTVRTAKSANFIPYTTGPQQSELPGQPTWHHIPQEHNSLNCLACQLNTIYHRTTTVRTARPANFIPYTTGPQQSELPGRSTSHHILQDHNSQNCLASQLHTIYHRTTTVRTARPANFTPYTTGPQQSELPGQPTSYHIPQDHNSQNCLASQLHTIYYSSNLHTTTVTHTITMLELLFMNRHC